MTEVISFWLDVNHNFPDREIRRMRVAEEANLRGINFVCSRSDIWDFKCSGYRFCVIAHQSEVGDGSSALRAFAKEMSLLTLRIL